MEQTNKLVGKTDVEGEGVIITLSDNENRSIEDTDLIFLMNELRLAGAEAISINEKRIVNMTEIVLVNDTILINGERVASPYVVKAIGNQSVLEGSLTQKKSGYIDKIIKAYDKLAQIEKVKQIEISKYSGEWKLKYIEGEN